MTLRDKLKDFRYQKMLKRLVNQAKERIHEQIDAAKKGKKFDDVKYYDKPLKEKNGTFDTDDWEDEKDEKGKIIGRRKVFF